MFARSGPATTDATGSFTVHGVGPHMRVVLTVDDPRLASQRIATGTDPSSAGKFLTRTLEPAQPITGRVTDATSGNPIPDAVINVTMYKANAGYGRSLQSDRD